MKRFSLIAAAFAVFAAAGAAHAFDVSPMRADLGVAGQDASAVITVRNPSSEPLPIEMIVKARTYAPDGSQTFEAAEGDWVVFPPQAVVQPGGSQAVRVQYIGSPVDHSASYVLYVSQVPVGVSEGVAVEVVYEFGVALYLNPPGAESEMIVRDVDVQGGVATVQIANQGGRYGVLSDAELELQVDGQTLSFSGEELRQVIANPIVPALGERVFQIQVGDRLPAGVGSGEVTETL